MSDLPILYSFRRCPYAMRARMALISAKQTVELREVVLREKPQSMLDVSPKATVPVMVLPNGEVLEESLDIMLWALGRSDPDNWLSSEVGSPAEMIALIEKSTGPFKAHLDAYKYAPRGKDVPLSEETMFHRFEGMNFVSELDDRLSEADFLFGNRLGLADIAIAPFIRQFAHVDANWFADQSVPNTQRWLTQIVSSELFSTCMVKFDQWSEGLEPVLFPVNSTNFAF